MTRNVLLAITFAAILRVWNRREPVQAPEPEQEPEQEPVQEPEPIHEPDPEPEPPKDITHRVKKSGISGLNLCRRIGLKHRIYIENLSQFYDFKIKYKALPMLKTFGVKGCTVEFIDNHECGELLVCRNDTEVVEATTWACEINIIRINPDGSDEPSPFYSGTGNSSRDITIVDRIPRRVRRVRKTNGCF